jgi:type IV conjugative transfer system coupling protein TraD
MSFTPKFLTQGGQITAYRLRMFGQVSNWIFHWILILFIAATGLLFWLTTPDDVLRNGFWFWVAWPTHSLLSLSPATATATWDIIWHCGNGTQLCTTKMTPLQLLSDPWVQEMGHQFLANLKFMAIVCGITASLLYCAIAWYVGHIGKKESEDEFISGMVLTEDPKVVNRQLRKEGNKSDLQIAGLHMVRDAEVMNFLIHGTIGVGKSTLIRWLLDFIRKRGDRAIIYDSGGTFIETHYDPRLDKILNAHDKRCENWVLWRECPEVVDYENLTASLMPVEGDSDPFWVSSSRTIFSDSAMQYAADPNRNIGQFLKTLLSIDLKSLREFLKNTPSANLVEEKIEKTAISIRSVLTNYAKALRYLQGLDQEGKPEFSIREWMTDEKYDASWLFISTTARHRKAVRPLISMWLSLATLLLQSMGENYERRVWFIGDEIAGLQKIPELNETLAESRKFGGCFVLGVQNIPQLVHIYGREMAKAIFDLLNTRAYGRSPSSEVAEMVEKELGHQRRREAKEQNSFGLDQIRDGISISKDKVKEPIVDYDQIMKLPNLNFYFRLPGEYPVVKLKLKYRKQKKQHSALIQRDFRDMLSPELETIIQNNERGAQAAGISFPTGELPQDEGEQHGRSVHHAESAADAVSPVTAPTVRQPTNEKVTEMPVVAPREPAVSGAQDVKPAAGNVRQFPQRQVMPPPVNVTPVSEPGKPAANDTTSRLQPDAAVVPPALLHTPAPTRPFAGTKPVAGPLSALEWLRKKPATSSSGEESTTAEANPQGEAPEMNMQIIVDDEGHLTVRTEGYKKNDQATRDEAWREEYESANRRMAEEERNILRHHHDYEEYEALHEHLDPGAHER